MKLICIGIVSMFLLTSCLISSVTSRTIEISQDQDEKINFSLSKILFPEYNKNNDFFQNSDICVNEESSECIIQSNNVWKKAFGGPKYDVGASVIQTPDGGYIITGLTVSYSPVGGSGWLIKTDENGDEIWNKTLGGKDFSYVSSVQQTDDDFDGEKDDGFIIAGCKDIYDDGDSMAAWLIKTDSNYNELWNKTYGGQKYDQVFIVKQTSDGGYIGTGRTSSYGAGFYFDLYLLKTDGEGNELWHKNLGDYLYEDVGTSVCEIDDDGDGEKDDGYLVTGLTAHAPESQVWDLLLIKTDSNGNEIWKKTFGGIRDDVGYCVLQNSNNEYIIVGRTESYDTRRNGDVWLLKTDSDGEVLWNYTFGGSAWDTGSFIQQTADGGYIITGSGLSEPGKSDDVYIVKIDSNGKIIWENYIGGENIDVGATIQQTADGGYVITGRTKSFGNGNYDVFFIKTDENGEIGGKIRNSRFPILNKLYNFYPNFYRFFQNFLQH